MNKPTTNASTTELQDTALSIRKRFLTIASTQGALHIGSSLSQIDILVALYGQIMHVTPDTFSDPARDRFILSKGHAALGYYCVLAHYGFIPWEEVERYGADDTRLAAHPVLGSAPGIEATTGSLGHGLPIALGLALAAKRSGSSAQYYVLLSDGECDEGSNWEAILLAGHLKLDNLTVIVDYNKIQSFGTTAEILDLEPFAQKWQAANWSVVECDGHAFTGLLPALQRPHEGKPHVVIAHTVKGKGVPYMENTLEWHYFNLKPEDLEKTLATLY